jgi:hypothetical protein
MNFRINIIIPTLLLLAILSACKHDIAMETTVYPDGSLDKTIHIAQEEGRKAIQEVNVRPDKTIEVTNAEPPQNILGLRVEDGWALTTRESTTDSAKVNTFHRHFSSADEANAALATPVDSLFRVSSTFEKKFRWFYTYIYYADTYRAINRMAYPVDDYVTPEDYSFINRLPAEGKKITPADSLYLKRLHDKLFEDYALRALFENYYTATEKFMRENQLENRWIDTLRAHKRSIFRAIVIKRDVDDKYLIHTLDSIGIPLSAAQKSAIPSTIVDYEDGKLAFMSYANDGTYHHQINMPWEVVRTNADSISGNRLFWSPPSIKFLLKDYTLYAESRQLNYSTVAISIAIVALTVFLFVRRRRPRKEVP